MVKILYNLRKNMRIVNNNVKTLRSAVPNDPITIHVICNLKTPQCTYNVGSGPTQSGFYLMSDPVSTKIIGATRR